MRIAGHTIACLVLCGLAGCASSPPAPPATAAAGNAGAATAAAETVQQHAAIEAAIRAGYHPRVRDGQQLYCREETPIGTRFSELHCYTIEQLTAAQRASDRLHDLLAKPITCGGSTCVAQ